MKTYDQASLNRNRNRHTAAILKFSYYRDVTTQEQKISSLAQGKFRQEQRPLNLRDKHFPSQ